MSELIESSAGESGDEAVWSEHDDRVWSGDKAVRSGDTSSRGGGRVVCRDKQCILNQVTTTSYCSSW